jgi:hypothetical protein
MEGKAEGSERAKEEIECVFYHQRLKKIILVVTMAVETMVSADNLLLLVMS